MKQKVVSATKGLADIVIDGLRDKKGLEIVKLDLRKLKSAISDYFIVCTGTSDTHVRALADSVFDKVKKDTGERPFSMEGESLGEWILMDYVNVVVHIFLKEKREFYSIEDLWGDAVIEKQAS